MPVSEWIEPLFKEPLWYNPNLTVLGQRVRTDCRKIENKALVLKNYICDEIIVFPLAKFRSI